MCVVALWFFANVACCEDNVELAPPGFAEPNMADNDGPKLAEVCVEAHKMAKLSILICLSPLVSSHIWMTMMIWSMFWHQLLEGPFAK